MTIQPMINLNEEQMNILIRVAEEHNVTAEEYLERICLNHCNMLQSMSESDVLAWSSGDGRS